MAFVLDEKLTTKWFDTLTVIPDDGDNVWFIVGDKTFVGKYIAEARVFTKADKSMVDLSCVRQWSPMNGEKQICKQPEEDQVIAAKIPNLPCYVTGIYSSNLSQKNFGVDGPGLLLDQDYNISELGVKSPVSWEEVFDWYELPLEPLLLLPVIQVGLVPITYSELISDNVCLSCQCEEPKPQETEQTGPKPTSAIVASKNRNLMENNNEVKPMNNKLTETRVSYELTQYGSYQPWGQAKEAWQYILDNGKFDALDSYLEELYPEGIGETELNDILAYEPESVYEAIGLEDPNAEEIWEHDNDFYDPEAPESEDEEEPIAEESYKGFDIYTWEGDLITVCKNGKYKSDADDIADAKRMIDEGILNESQIREAREIKGLDDNVKDWYLKEFKYDDLGPELNDDFTFMDVYVGMAKGQDVYDIFGVGDSLVREHIFNELAKRLRVSYDTIYGLWLGESKKSSKNRIHESNDDGWSDEIELIFDEVMADSANFSYEIQHCRRGVYTGATTPEVLAQAAYKIADKWNEAGEACEVLKEEEFDESKKSKVKKFKEDYGWECDPDNAWDLLDEMKEVFGADYLLESLAKAMGTYDLAETLAFICRNEDFRSQYLGNLDEEEDDDEEIEESKKSDRDLSHLPESVAKQVSDYFNLIKL